MKYIYSRLTAGPEKSLIVFLEHQANVFLVEADEFDHYRFGGLYRCRGGWTRCSPLLVRIPSHSSWCLIVDLADQNLEVSAHVELIDSHEADVIAWDDLTQTVPLHKGFRPRDEDFVPRGIWVVDSFDDPDTARLASTPFTP